MSLPHPFRGWEDFDWDYDEPAPLKVNNRDVEKTDGSNCYIGGDRFCDTDPDYLSDRWSCNSALKSTIVQHDPDSVAFRSDATLIMGYASDHCASRFSEEQIAAMRANLRDEHQQYLQISAPLEDIDDQAQVELISPIDTTETVQYNHIELKWNPVPNAKFYTVEVSLVKSFTVKFYQETFENATSVVITSGIPNNRNLYWRVRAYNSWDICQPYNTAQIGIFRTQNLSATNELERSAIIQLAPNPVLAGMPATLNIESEAAMDLSVSLSDAAGRVCYQNRHRLSTGQNQLEITTTNLGPGLYTVLLQNEKGTIVKRLAVVE
ncbi:MAG: T9SS type A sorting domain-containing protein [Lewinellaceae bacterium]|nr:T9SS type A sorting domain-containing protein [Lewinellaceae bacterium]